MINILSMSVEEFGNYIRRIREGKGFALSKVEAQSDGQITGSYVNQIENGQKSAKDISLGKLLGLAKGLQISVEELLTIALGEEFGNSSTFRNKISSALIPTEEWSDERKETLLNFIQIFTNGMYISHFVPKFQGGVDNIENLQFFDAESNELLRSRFLLASAPVDEPLSDEVAITQENDKGDLDDEKKPKAKKAKTK